MARVKAKGSKPRWWKPLWIAVLLMTIASGVVGYFLLHVPLERMVSGVALTFLFMGIGYYIRIKPSMKVNRAIYVTLGACGIWVIVFFGGGLLLLSTGWLPLTTYLGPWVTFIIFFIFPYIIGAFIGDWIGRRRNYRLPLSI